MDNFTLRYRHNSQKLKLKYRRFKHKLELKYRRSDYIDTVRPCLVI